MHTDPLIRCRDCGARISTFLNTDERCPRCQLDRHLESLKDPTDRAHLQRFIARRSAVRKALPA